MAENGVYHLLDNHVQPDIKNIDDKLYKRLTDIFYQQSFESIRTTDSKLRTYSLIKQTVGIENYLKRVTNHKLRSGLTRLRLSSHKLMIEVGRHQKIPLANRSCPFCPEYVEDEIHFITNCKLYKDTRNPMLEKCINLKPNFPYYTDQQKFIFIMTCPLLTFDLIKFISCAMEKRDLTT